MPERSSSDREGVKFIVIDPVNHNVFGPFPTVSVAGEWAASQTHKTIHGGWSVRELTYIHPDNYTDL